VVREYEFVLFILTFQHPSGEIHGCRACIAELDPVPNIESRMGIKVDLVDQQPEKRVAGMRKISSHICPAAVRILLGRIASIDTGRALQQEEIQAGCCCKQRIPVLVVIAKQGISIGKGIRDGQGRKAIHENCTFPGAGDDGAFHLRRSTTPAGILLKTGNSGVVPVQGVPVDQGKGTTVLDAESLATVHNEVKLRLKL